MVSKQSNALKRQELEKELEELMRSLPAHSLSPTMQMRIDEIEEELSSMEESTDNGSGRD